MASKFGAYEIVEPLGSGGMASVYKAYDPALERYVALKVLPARLLEQPSFADRFRNEARLIARLEHPNIVPVHAFGIQDGAPWMAMRLMWGGPLSELLGRERLSLRRISEVVSQVADALEHAHARQIVHRDVKPANVLLDREGRIYLADFGIACVVVAVNDSEQGTVSGTPAYMAPEQARGERVDPRSDLYSLGVLAFEMLTGDRPFVGDSAGAILLKHIHEPAVMPSSCRIPEPVARVVLRSLEKVPEDRWSSVASFAAALDDAVETATTSIVQQSTATLFCIPDGDSGRSATFQSSSVSRPDVPAVIEEPLLEMEVSLLLGHPKAALRAAQALAKAVVGRRGGTTPGDNELGAERARKFRDLLQPALPEREARAASDLPTLDAAYLAADAVRNALRHAGLLDETFHAALLRRARQEASGPSPGNYLTLDRTAQRIALADMIVPPPRVLAFAVHGEVEQGHEYFTANALWQIRGTLKGAWREVLITWPAPGPPTGGRLGDLFDRVAEALVRPAPAAPRDAPRSQPLPKSGDDGWEAFLDRIRQTTTESGVSLFVRHTIRWPAPDDGMVGGAYLDRLWAPLKESAFAGCVVLAFEIVRAPLVGVPVLARSWRLGFQERRNTRSIADAIEDFGNHGPGVKSLVVPELQSVTEVELSQWLKTHGGRRRQAAGAEARDIIAASRLGRFDLVVQRLAGGERGVA